jgi:hypothetical protein
LTSLANGTTHNARMPAGGANPVQPAREIANGKMRLARKSVQPGTILNVHSPQIVYGRTRQSNAMINAHC